LPFTNMSGDKEQEYFSDGLAEEIINALAQIPGLKVTARTSAFFFEVKDVKVAQIASELGVEHILEGNVRATGLRTSILVCLAAYVAMLQVNLLQPLAGRSSNSFVMNDLMRQPLGILSGMGFIGGGAIVRRNNFVVGVTTAATLWFLTVIGLCFGGGQVALGLVGAALALLVLTGLKLIEGRIKQGRQGRLLVMSGAGGPDEDEIRAMLQNGGYRISFCAFVAAEAAGERELHWRARPDETKIPEWVYRLAARTGVSRVTWDAPGAMRTIQASTCMGNSWNPERTAHAIAIGGTAFDALRVTRTGVLSHSKGLAYPTFTIIIGASLRT
jgi:putative Mg2+ transporter-C (MgtC) family protein